jgi:excisionase family DNA binding protein
MTERGMEISVGTAARIAGCSRDTVLRLIEERAIEARRATPLGWWKVKKESLERYLEAQTRWEKDLENTANDARFSGLAARF